MARPQIGVLALQGNVREHARALTAAGADPLPVRRARELDAVEAIIIPGGESTTIDHLLRAFELRDPLRARLAAGMPAYGSCAGMILLADRIVDPATTGDGGVQQTLGGIAMTVRRNAFGRQIDSFEAPLTWRGPGADEGPFPGVFIRAPWVEAAEEQVDVLATVPFAGDEQVVAVRQGNLIATAFHPELTDDLRVHRLLIDLVSR